MTIRGLYNKIAAIDTDAIALQCIDETTEEIRQYQLKQLLDGKNSTGSDMTTYMSDPYFKTPEAAAKYSRWKDEISPKSNRKSGVKNYFINGYFHDSIKVIRSGDKVVTASAVPLGQKIVAKEPYIFGLSPQSKSEFIPLVLRPRFNQKLAALIGLKFR